jgi:Uncharacterized protein conserved in bacteria (DUF2252)
MSGSADLVQQHESPGERQTKIVDVLVDAFSELMDADPDAFRQKFRKMAADPFAFYRGSACLFYADMERPLLRRRLMVWSSDHRWFPRFSTRQSEARSGGRRVHRTGAGVVPGDPPLGHCVLLYPRFLHARSCTRMVPPKEAKYITQIAYFRQFCKGSGLGRIGLIQASTASSRELRRSTGCGIVVRVLLYF